MDVTSTVFHRQPARFNMAGQFLGYPLRETEEVISDGLKSRLAKYAQKRLEDLGLLPQEVTLCDVSTDDADQKPSDRSYQVEFHTEKGGIIGVAGILTKSGWPCLDHGMFIDEQ